MGERRANRRIWTSIACVTLLASAGAGQGAEGLAAIRDDVAATYVALSEPVKTARSIEELPGFGGAVEVTADPLPDLPAAEVSLIDMRVPLLQMAQTAGANGQLSVLRAQAGDTPRALVIKDGVVALDDALAQAAKLADVLGEDGLRLPLVIWPGARLEIREGETLRLSRADGAFLANFGELVVDGGVIEGAGAENATVPEFAPFMVTAGTGFMVIRNARLEHLGFDSAPAFAGLAVINGGLYPSKGRSVLNSSILRDVASVVLKGAAGPTVSRNLFFGAHGKALELRHTLDAVVSGNLFVDGRDGNAIRVTQGALRTEIHGNRIFRSAGGAIRVDEASHETRISDNLIWESHGVGITLEDSDCAVIEGNLALENRQKGISLRASRGTAVVDNRILGNGSAGLFVADQPGEVPTRIEANLFAGNRAGVASASGGTLALAENDLSDQFPRFFDGDLNGLTPEIVGNLLGDRDLLLRAGVALLTGLPDLTCSPEKES